ncbi:hypothetical protein ABC345_03695 [Shouchella sp. 1P09AA]|uniref:hypothetical protein n=1 Tax=unclassified Shouchella TaxID=2893065 RepID=UPI0039A0F4E7
MRKANHYAIGQVASRSCSFHLEDLSKWKALGCAEEGHSAEKRHVPWLMSEGFISDVMSNTLPGVPCVMMQKELYYLHPVYVGDELTTYVEIIDVNEERNWLTEKVTCMNQEGIEVIKGQVVLKQL